jgi:hypothetical protein
MNIPKCALLAELGWESFNAKEPIERIYFKMSFNEIVKAYIFK